MFTLYFFKPSLKWRYEFTWIEVGEFFAFVLLDNNQKWRLEEDSNNIKEKRILQSKNMILKYPNFEVVLKVRSALPNLIKDNI